MVLAPGCGSEAETLWLSRVPKESCSPVAVRKQREEEAVGWGTMSLVTFLEAASGQRNQLQLTSGFSHKESPSKSPTVNLGAHVIWGHLDLTHHTLLKVKNQTGREFLCVKTWAQASEPKSRSKTKEN